MQISKKELRAELLQRRRSMDKNTMQKKDEAIYNNIVQLPQLMHTGNILCYISTDIEVGTRRLISELIDGGKSVYAPRCKGKDMRFFRLERPDDTKTGAFGIPEPIGDDEITDFFGTVCIVPALSFDKSGYRIGYGGGYYDRFLRAYNGTSIGICYNEFIGAVLREEHDLNVDILVTEDMIYDNLRQEG